MNQTGDISQGDRLLNKFSVAGMLLAGLAVLNTLLVFIFGVGVEHSYMIVLLFTPPLFALIGIFSSAVSFIEASGRKGLSLALGLIAFVLCSAVMLFYLRSIGRL